MPLFPLRVLIPASLLFLAATCAAAPAATKAAASPPKPQGLNRKQLADELTKLADAPALRRARVSVAVMDLSNGDWLFDSNGGQPLIVASNNKLATTAAALELLGPDFEFRTTVSACGKVLANGVLEGDLLLVGRGDPSLSGRFHQGKTTAVLAEWADAVAKAGIKSVRGGIVADESYFDRQHLHPGWPPNQFQAWYCAPVSALTFNDNCVFVTVRPGAKPGDTAIASTDPPTSYVDLVTTCRTTKARLGGNQVLVSRRKGENRLTISGEIRAQGAPLQMWITIHEPALYTGTVFAEVLEAKGIRVGGPVRLLTPPERIEPAKTSELITTTSLLRDAVTVANRNSQNLYAELILKTLGREKAGQGTWVAGAGVVEKFLRDAGVTGAISYFDGSGLARTNRFSARQLVQLLCYANGRRWGALYLHSLAEPGEGTLSRRLDSLKGHLFAKTGYIAGVSALSGYLDTRGGRLLAFSILVNEFRSSLADVRDAQDAICLKLAEYSGGE